MNEKWYERWALNGWKNSNKKPVENKDLWERIILHLSKQNLNFYHIKGHVNLKNERTDIDALYNKFLDKNNVFFTKDNFIYITEMNNRADELANIGIVAAKEASINTKES